MRIDSISSPSQIWDICVTSTWKYEARPETIASKTIELCSSGSRNRDGSESAIRTIQFSSSFDGFKSLETSDLPTALRPPKTVQILGFVRLSFEPSSIDISYVTAEREREREEPFRFRLLYWRRNWKNDMVKVLGEITFDPFKCF